MTKKEYLLGELFCGPGGIAYGALSVKVPGVTIQHAWANDFDKDTCRTYIRNICPDNSESVICKDVRELDIASLGSINALAFGFPCNDFSLVGQKKGLNGEYGPLYKYGKIALEIFHPEWFFAENVGGLKADDGGKTLSLILREYADCGYKLYPHLYKFEEYGIPQTRHRIIIIGIRNDLPYEYKVPSPEGYRMKTCREAIECPPIPSDAANNNRRSLNPRVRARLEYIKPGQNAFNADIPDSLKLHIKGATLSHIYKRLDPNRPSYTVTGCGGGGTHMYHWSENRALTNRERARLQTFPDSFVFEGNDTQVRKQVGMAVPCEGARVIIEALMKSIVGIDYKSIPCSISF
ncbi:MAG: DNA (cytosine-5-)-methyltransferase [Candidatus Ornithospirochaeta sp.]|nr:DNA (cytosine-5-)-methyltransferase [Candidatus Ornithospirochaeta sp.]